MKNSFKKGDRVRWTGAYDSALANKNAVGQLGTVKDNTEDGQETTEVNWDRQDHGTAFGLGKRIYNDNLELVPVDVTKSLVVDDADRPVTFVTETSDQRILVGDEDGRWMVFERDGTFVRGSDAIAGRFLRLRNRKVVHKVRVVLDKTGLPVVDLWGIPNLEVIVEDGKIVSMTVGDLI